MNEGVLTIPHIVGECRFDTPKIVGVCRYCKKEVSEYTATSTNSYWHAYEDICHKDCKDAGIKNEAYDCQCIDADCNDCRHFKRGEYIGTPYKYAKGTCIKFNKPTNAFALTCTDHKCFEHRRGLIIKLM